MLIVLICLLQAIIAREQSSVVRNIKFFYLSKVDSMYVATCYIGSTLHLFNDALLKVEIFFSVYPFTNVYQCLPVFTSVYQCLPVPRKVSIFSIYLRNLPQKSNADIVKLAIPLIYNAIRASWVKPHLRLNNRNPAKMSQIIEEQTPCLSSIAHLFLKKFFRLENILSMS